MNYRRWLAACVVLGYLLVGALVQAPQVDADDDDGVIVVDAEVVVVDKSDGKCSLLEAAYNVTNANKGKTDCPTGDGVSTIRLPTGIYSLDEKVDLGRVVTIEGAGAGKTILDADGNNAILNFNGNSLTVAGVTLQRGSSQSGAAIRASGTGLDSLTIRDSSFEDNSATKNGGSIYFTGNTLTILRSTFARNSAAQIGGAVAVPGGAANVVVANSTFVENTAQDGGVFGVVQGSFNDALVIKNSTFFGNDSQTNGDGLHLLFKSLLLANSIVAKGSATHTSCTGNSEPMATGSKDNLTDDASCTRNFSTLGADALGTLGQNGGTTPTMLPSATSGAIDAGDDETCRSSPVDGIDQRGLSRTAQGEACDIGAVEIQDVPDATAGATLSATMSVAGTFAPGSEVTYTAIIANSGDGAQADNPGHEFTDTLPGALALVSASASAGTVVADTAGGSVTWDGSLAAGGEATVTIVARIADATAFDVVSNQGALSFDGDGDATNESQAVTDDPGTDDVGDATAFVVEAPVVSATMTTTTTGPYHPGDRIAYQVIVRNGGNAAATGVVVGAQLDANATLVAGSVTSSAGTAGDGTDGAVDVDAGDVPHSGQLTVEFAVTVVAPAPIGLTQVSAQATISGTNFEPFASDSDGDATNGATPDVQPIVTTPALSLDITGGDTVTAGGSATYTLGYTNSGDVALAGVVLSATVPGSTTFASAGSTAGWDCEPGGTEGSTCTLVVGTLDSAADGSATFVVTADDAVTVSTISFSASVRNELANATATATTTVLAAELTASLDGPATVFPGGDGTYTLTIVNSGTAPAIGASVQVTLPIELTFVASPGCIAVDQVATCVLPTVPRDGGQVSSAINFAVKQDAGDGSTFSAGATVNWDHAPGPTQSDALVTTVEAVDLGITILAGVPTVVPGEQITYTVGYANTGSATASGVVIEYNLPAKVTFNAASSDARWTCANGDCTLGVGALPGHGNGTAALVVTLSATGAGTTSITGDVAIHDDAAHGADRDSTDNSAQVITAVVRPEVTAVLSGPGTVYPGLAGSFDVSLSNDGAAPATGISLSTTLPAGLTFVASTGCAADSQLVTCSLADIDAGGGPIVATINFMVGARVADGTVLSAAASIDWDGGVAPLATNVVESTVAAVDVGVTIAADTTTVAPGGKVAYTIGYANTGSAAAGGVVITYALAAGVTFVPSASDAGWVCDGAACTLAVGAVGGGANGTATLAVSLLTTNLDAGSITGAASIHDDGAHGVDADDTNNSAQVTTTVVRPDLSASLTGPDTISPGATLLYEVTVRNDGFAPASAVTVSDPLPPGLSFDAGGSSAGCSAVEALVTCVGGELAAGGSTTFTIAVLAAASLTDGTLVSNQPSAAAAVGETVTANNTSIATVTTVAAADLRIGIVAPESVRPGGSLVATINITNAGSAAAEEASVAVLLPAGVVFDAAESSDGCSVDVGVIRCGVGAIAAGGTASATVVETVASDAVDGTLLSGTADVSAGRESLATLDDNSATFATTVAYLLAIHAVIDGPPNTTTGQPLAYNVTLSNGGDAADVDIDISAPAGLLIDGVTPATGFVCEPVADTSVRCNGAIAAGAAAAFVVAAHSDGSMAGDVTFAVSGRAFTGTSEEPLHEQAFATKRTVTVLRTIDVRLSASAMPSRVLPGSAVRLQVEVSNAGDVVEDGKLRVVLPSGLVFEGVESDEQLLCAGRATVECAVDGEFAASASVTATVVAQVDASVTPGASLGVAVSFEHAGGTTGLTTAIRVAELPPDIVIDVADGTPTTNGEDSDPQTYTYDLHFRWSLITWVGEDGIAPGEALGGAGNQQTGAGVAAVYAFDAETQRWLGFFPASSVPGANDLEAFELGRVYWVALDGAEQLGWTVQMAAPGA